MNQWWLVDIHGIILQLNINKARFLWPINSTLKKCKSLMNLNYTSNQIWISMNYHLSVFLVYCVMIPIVITSVNSLRWTCIICVMNCQPHRLCMILHSDLSSIFIKVKIFWYRNSIAETENEAWMHYDVTTKMYVLSSFQWLSWDSFTWEW